MHQDPSTDHEPVFGRIRTAEDEAEWQRQLDLPRIAEDGSVYTTRQYDLDRQAAARRKAAKKNQDAEPDQVHSIELPPPEVYSTLIDRKDDRFPGGCATIANLADKNGWTWWTTYSRGPRTHATTGAVLGISDYVVMRLRLDGTDRRAVGLWIDTKFDVAWILTADFAARKYHCNLAKSDVLKAWIRNEELP